PRPGSPGGRRRPGRPWSRPWRSTRRRDGRGGRRRWPPRRGSHPVEEVGLLAAELLVADHALLAELVEAGQLVDGVRGGRLGRSEHAPLVELDLAVDLVLDLGRPGDVVEGLAPRLAGR